MIVGAENDLELLDGHLLVELKDKNRRVNNAKFSMYGKIIEV